MSGRFGIVLREMAKKQQTMNALKYLLKGNENGTRWISKGVFPWYNKENCSYNLYCYTRVKPITNTENEDTKKITAIYIDNNYGNIRAILGQSNRFPMKVENLPVDDIEKIVESLVL